MVVPPDNWLPEKARPDEKRRHRRAKTPTLGFRPCVFVPTADGVAQNRRGLCDADHTSPVPQRQDGEAGPTLRNTRVYRRGLQALQQGTMGRRTRKPGSVGDAIVNSKSELKPLWDFLRAATKRNLQANLARQFDTQIGRNFASSAPGHFRRHKRRLSAG
jgi:hypothetical protein